MWLGYGILKETVADLIGERIDSKLAKDIKDCINSFDEVNGIYDLIIHNFACRLCSYRSKW